MPQEGNIKVKEWSNRLVTVGVHGYPLNFGAQNKAVKLLGVNLLFSAAGLSASGDMITALSSNPNHLDAPPAYPEILLDEALYARQHYDTVRVGDEHSIFFHNQWMPLYGLLRPTRQILIVYNLLQNNCVLAMEWYYEEIELSQTIQDDLNLVYGKYRRPR